MVEVSVVSSWKEMVKSQVEECITKLKQNFKQTTGKVSQNADVYLTYKVLMFLYQQIKLQKIFYLYVKGITLRC